MEGLMPETFARARGDLRASSKARYRDMQDIEFTVQEGKLWMLQTRSGKRTTQAASEDRRRHGREGPPDRSEEAVARINPAQLDQLLHPTCWTRTPRREGAGQGPAGLAGAAVGEIVFNADEAEDISSQ